MKIVTPEQIEEAKVRNRVIAGLVREHFEALTESGFDENEAFQLAENYHGSLLDYEEEE